MPIPIECLECEYEGSASDTKAGKSIACPDCGEPIFVDKPERKASRQPSVAGRKARVQTDHGSTAKIVLLGSVVLLLGVGIMLAIRMYSIPQEDLVAASNQVLYGNKDSPVNDAPQTAIDEAGLSNNQITAAGVSGAGGPVGDDSDKLQQTESNSDLELAAGSASAGELDDETESTAVVAISPQQLLMARMSELVVNVIGFPEDVRGTVRTAIESSTAGAMQSCKLDCVRGSGKPVMQLKLSLADVNGTRMLSVAAELQADMQGIPVKLWERSENLVSLDDKALQNGILLPNLDRSLGTFFTTLRGDLVDARRAVLAMEKTK